MADMTAIRLAIKATIRDNVPGIKVYERLPETAATLPCVIVIPNNIDFDMAFAKGTDAHFFSLLVLASYNDLETAQNNLDAFVSGSGSKSIRAAVFAHRDLGTVGWDAHITSMTDYGARFQGAAIEHVGAKLNLVVYTRGYA